MNDQKPFYTPGLTPPVRQPKSGEAGLIESTSRWTVAWWRASAHIDGGNKMPTKLLTVVVLAVAAVAGSSQRTAARGQKDHLLAHGVEQHCRSGCSAVPRVGTEGVTLIFSSMSGDSALAIDFLPRENRQQAPDWIDMVVAFTSRGSNPIARNPLSLFIDSRTFHLATRTDNRGNVMAPILFADFERLGGAREVAGQIFGVDFTLSAEQLAVLRFVARRWAAGESMFSLQSISHETADGRSG